jgi:D-alanyl-D-alanine carboxypeptidase (penicillin-binding protein 5/6)
MPNFLSMFRHGVAVGACLLVLAAMPAWAIDTEARQALIVDVATGTILLDKDADSRMPPSSMSKLMTAYVVFDQMKQGKLSLTDELPVSEGAWRKGGSKMFVQIGSRVKVEDLIRGMIIQSGNDACIVLAEGIAGSEDAFATLMNKTGQEFGLTGTHFSNSTGWPDANHYMTARDIVTVARRLIRDFPEHMHFYSELEFVYNGIKQGNRNPLLYKNIGADGMKTGHTEEAGYGLAASVRRDGRHILMVINGLKTMKSRAQESERLIEWSFREFANYALVKAGDKVEDADVWLGAQAKVPLVTARDAFATLPRRSRKDMKVTVIYDGPLKAPVTQGQEVGKLVITAPEVATQEIPLLAGASVERLGVFGRMASAMGYLVSARVR